MLTSLLLHLPNACLASVVIREGVAIAQRHQARVRSLAIVDTGRICSVAATTESAGYAAVEEERLQRLEKTCSVLQSQVSQSCLQAGLNFDIRTIAGGPPQLLRRESQFHDLVITAWHQAGKACKAKQEQGALLRSSKELLAIAATGAHPLLVLRPNSPVRPRVLIACDGTVATGRAIRSYVKLGLWAGHEVRLIGVARDVSEAAQNLREIVDYCASHGLHPETGTICGAPHRVLVPYTQKWEADLVVLGAEPETRGWNPVRKDFVRDLLRKTDAALFLG